MVDVNQRRGAEESLARTALVTGGAKGIGRAISEKLAAAGWQLWLCGRDQRALDQAASEIGERHSVEVRTTVVDLSQEGGAQKVLAPFEHARDLPLVMVCGAADYGVLGPLQDVDFGAWKRSFDLNFFSFVELVHRYLRLAGAGPHSPRRRIVIIGGAGLGAAQVSGAISAHSCAKSALNRLVEVVHEEVHSCGIDINCVLPGFVNTGMGDQAIAAGPVLGRLYEASIKAKAGVGDTPAEIPGEFIARLVSDECAGISGRLFSAKWDQNKLSGPESWSADRDLFRLRRIDNDLFGKLK